MQSVVQDYKRKTIKAILYQECMGKLVFLSIGFLTHLKYGLLHEKFETKIVERSILQQILNL